MSAEQELLDDFDRIRLAVDEDFRMPRDQVIAEVGRYRTENLILRADGQAIDKIREVVAGYPATAAVPVDLLRRLLPPPRDFKA